MDLKEDEVKNRLKTKTIVDTKKGFVGTVSASSTGQWEK